MFWTKKNEYHRKTTEKKNAAIDEELRIANGIIQRFSKWKGDERRAEPEPEVLLERRHMSA